MTVVSLLLTSIAFQGTKANDLRLVEVKPAGLAVSVPKAWAQNPKDGNLSASLKVPIAGSKLFGKMDIGYVQDESKDVDGFLDATKSVLTVGGNTIERQWKVDIMTSPLALTRFNKDGITTVRGVLFRPMKSKFVISVSAGTSDFEKVEPYLLSTLESMREVKVIQPKAPVIAEERRIAIKAEGIDKELKLPLSQAVTIGSKTAMVRLPAGCTFTKVSDSIISCTLPQLGAPIILMAYSTDGNQPSLVFQTKAAETSKLFKGAIQRIDETSNKHGDKQIRDFIWRTGIGEKDGMPIMTMNCVTTQAAPMFLTGFYVKSGSSISAKDRQVLTKFMTTVRLTEK